MNVGELSEDLSISQSNVSKHLKILKEKGLVTFEKSGTTVTYSLSDDRVVEAMDLLRSIMADHVKKHSEILVHTIL